MLCNIKPVPFHESDKHIFAKIPGGVRTPGPPLWIRPCCRISKISNEVERNDNFRALARKLSFLSTELDIFDIRQHYVRILFIFQRLIC